MQLLARLVKLHPESVKVPEPGPVVLKTGPLGRPVLYLGEERGPGVSFSHAGDWLWGALCAEGEVGLDVALTRDFLPPYPYSRVFRPEEWHWSMNRLKGRSPWAAALLWAAKEAAAKALGVGFYRWPPIAFEVNPPVMETEGLLLAVQVHNNLVATWACPLEEGWLALAVL